VGDKEAQEMFELLWHPGLENLADYQSKHHPWSHHTADRPYYLHMENSPRILPRALLPGTLKGCVGTLEGGYVRNVPLPRVPGVQSASLVTGTSCETMNAVIDTCYSQVQCAVERSRQIASRFGEEYPPLFSCVGNVVINHLEQPLSND
jgi:hypothetical protein